MRWRWAVAGVVAAGAVAVGVMASSSSGSGTRDLIVTATAVRRTLDDKITLTGQLSRVEQRKLVTPVAAQISQVQVKDGDVVQASQPILAIDGRDAVAEKGSFPFFRALDVGDSGEDVRQLDEILAAAGDSPGPISTLYTEQTRFALAQWQAAHGYPGAAPQKPQTVTVSLAAGTGYKTGAKSTAAVIIGPTVPAATQAATTAAVVGPAVEGVHAELASLRRSDPGTTTTTNPFNQPTLTIQAVNEVTAKGTPATFIVYTSVTTNVPLKFQLATGGTAGPDDVLPPPGPLVIPAGASSVQVQVPTRLNGLVEPDKTLSVTLEGGDFYVVGSPDTAETRIVSGDVPKISLIGGGNVDPGQPATIIVSADQAPIQDTEVDVSVAGDATPLKDYQPIVPAVILPAGQIATELTVTTLASDTIQPDKHIVISLVPGGSYAVGAVKTATITILGPVGDQALPVVTLETSAHRVTKGQPFPVTIGLDRPSSTELTVGLAYGGTAVEGVDYTIPAGELVIAAGQTSLSVQVPTIADNLVEPDTILFVSVATSSTYRIGTQSAVATSIVSSSLPELTLSAGSSTVAAGGATTFRITADQPPAKDTSVNFQVVGTAQPGQDYQPLTGTAILPAGQVSVDVVLRTINRNVVFRPTDMIVANWPIRIGQVFVKEGDVVQPGTAVVSLTDTGFTVTLTASPSDRTRLSVGQSTTVKLQGGDAQATGVISQLDDNISVDDTTKQQVYKGKISVGDLGAADGAAVTIDVVLQEKKNVLTVPIAAVKQNGAGQDVVRVIDLAHGGHVTEVPVKTGLAVDSYIEVQSGIKDNDVVIVESDQTKG